MLTLGFTGEKNDTKFFESLISSLKCEHRDTRTNCLVYIHSWSPIPGFDPIESQRRMERFAIDRQGLAALYAETQLTEEEYREMFNCQGLVDLYERLRRAYKCEDAFPTVYEKISKLGRSMS